jgi:hypothetical protein
MLSAHIHLKNNIPSNNKNTYVKYNRKNDVKALNMNTVQPGTPINVFPTNIYTGQLFPVPYYICGSGEPRDNNTDYIIDVERDQHPDHFSRFSRYAGSDLEYVSGPFNGKYNEGPNCSYDEQPNNMAPARFYDQHFQGQCTNNSASYIQSYKTRSSPNGMGYN